MARLGWCVGDTPDGELDALESAVQRAPVVVLIEGEAGVGKTRLLREVLASQEERGGRLWSVPVRS
ncbi:ATP-binding protein [Streptomyces sp. NPDC048279]|uniref:ATP-binding protein n=1 Tax=Streptomyces sp. NPDC048279 TaxID=3154714 RepID=UPI0034496AAF